MQCCRQYALIFQLWFLQDLESRITKILHLCFIIGLNEYLYVSELYIDNWLLKQTDLPKFAMQISQAPYQPKNK